ncbi:DAHL domain-containing protein [Sphingomonas sp. ASY06-1R]|uniref:DAHL domain-containing protein n=1 Tax=Sphingomonas sp. ASY06-1R TaxID=3445771 RepID=UPI003FA3293A
MYLRIATGLLLVVSIVLGVTTIRTMDETRRWASRASNGLMGYDLAQESLQLDLLDARAGLLRNYDPVNTHMESARANLADLQKLPISPEARRILQRLVAKGNTQEALVERFKSDNALLQNSLTRFTANEGAEAGALSILSASILKLTLDTSPQAVTASRAALKRLPPTRDGTPTAQLISHTQLLLTVLPEIDTLLHTIRDTRMESRIDDLQAALRRESNARSAVVSRLKLSTATALFLLAVSVMALVVMQRLHTRELHARAANARLSAAIATPLIDTGHTNFVSRVREAVLRLAQHIGARRIQLIIPGVSNSAQFSWPFPGSDDAWLPKLVRAANADRAWSGDRVVISRAGRSAFPTLDAAMRAASIDNLVLLRTAAPVRVVIGFEPENLVTAQRGDHMAGVSSAIIAIAHGARREAMQLERERLERTLARARRMETVGAMASGVAHNFNNIIGAIGGFAEMGQERLSSGSSARHSFDEIQSAVGRARDLVDEILDFAKQGRSAKRPINLFDLLREAVRMLSASVRDDSMFLLSPSEEQYPVLGAVSDLQQVFLNICNNAFQISGGAPVIIEARRVDAADEQRLSHGTLEPGRYVVVAISDAGPGIADAARSRLFEPFFTTKRGGTGLGLSTAWEIVQDHGGTIDVTNLAGRGACFSVWLPEMNQSGHVPSAGGGASILLLCDPGDLVATEDVIAELGYEPRGFVLGTATPVLLDVLAECDAVLIATRQAGLVGPLIRALATATDARPILLAIPDGQTADLPVAVLRLHHPIRPCEVSLQLARAMAVGGLTPEEVRTHHGTTALAAG